MPVVECKYAIDSGSADFDERNLGTYRTRYLITTDTTMGPRQVADEAQQVGPQPLPSFWSSYAFLGDTDDTSYFRSLSLRRRRNNRRLWRAELTYLPVQPGEVFISGLGGFNDPTPANRPPVWEGDGEAYTVLVEEDKDGNALLNAAGSLFDPTLEREQTRCVAVATNNYGTLDEVFDVMTVMSNAVNELMWRGQPPRSVLCRDPRPLPQVTEGAITYFPVQFRFVLQESGKTWDDRILEQGFSYLQVPGDPASRVQVDGTEPVLLNADGTRRNTGVGLFTARRTLREVNFADVLGF